MIVETNNYIFKVGFHLTVSVCATKNIGIGSKDNILKMSLQKISYVLVNSKPDHPPPPRAIPGYSFPLPWGQVFAQLLLPGGRGFKLEKFSRVLKDKCRNFSICFKETGGSFKSRYSCAVSH